MKGCFSTLKTYYLNIKVLLVSYINPIILKNAIWIILGKTQGWKKKHFSMYSISLKELT